MFYRLFYLQFSIKVISKKHWTARVWEISSIENNRNFNSHRFNYKFAFILFLSFLTNQTQESSFQQVGGLVTRNISAFCLQRVALDSKAMPNSVNFYKGIFLHDIPVCIVVPCFEISLENNLAQYFICLIPF